MLLRSVPPCPRLSALASSHVGVGVVYGIAPCPGGLDTVYQGAGRSNARCALYNHNLQVAHIEIGFRCFLYHTRGSGTSIEAKKKEAPAKRTVKHARRTTKERVPGRTYRWVENCFYTKEAHASPSAPKEILSKRVVHGPNDGSCSLSQSSSVMLMGEQGDGCTSSHGSCISSSASLLHSRDREY